MTQPIAPDDEELRRANEEAALWYVRFQSGDTSEEDPDFLDWLAASPFNAAAVTRAEQAWRLFDSPDSASPEILKVRHQALKRSGRRASRRWAVFAPLVARVPLIAAAALLFAVSASVGVAALNDAARQSAPVQGLMVLHTDIGETRTLTLSDNSRISLDAATRLEVNYSEAARDVRLLSGQAHFEVAKDRRRPFRVRAGDRTIIATGTAFNVELVGQDVRVTLLEGEVVVTETPPPPVRASVMDKPAPQPSAPALKLRPGEQLIASVAAPAHIADDVNIEKTSAWREGRVFLQGDTLSEAVERMNRYSHIKLTIAGTDIDDLQMSGVFRAGDTDAFIEAVEATLPVEARRMAADRIEFHARS